MKLQQNQIWQKGDHYLRIVQLERLSVDYKLMKNLATREGSHHHATKKEFCRLLKGAALLSSAELKSKIAESAPAHGDPAGPAPQTDETGPKTSDPE